MVTGAPKPNGVKRAPTNIWPQALARLQFVKVHLQPVESDTDFLTKAADERCRRLIKRLRITLPPHLEFPSTQQ